MAYTAEKPPLAESSDELRRRIPGWGVDLDPKDRPSVPQEKFDPELSGAHWEFPERQPERWPRERSIEHKFLTPVFGTSCPPRGVSGAIRKLAYRRYSEGRAAHWMLLIAADRVDAWEHHLQSFLTLRPDNPITETGVLSEFSRHGISSRVGQRRADLAHQPLDPLIVAGPWVAAAAVGGYLAYKSIRAVTDGSRSLSDSAAAVADPPTDTNGARGSQSRRPRWRRLRTLFSNERISGSSLLSSVG